MHLTIYRNKLLKCKPLQGGVALLSEPRFVVWTLFIIWVWICYPGFSFVFSFLRHLYIVCTRWSSFMTHLDTFILTFHTLQLAVSAWWRHVHEYYRKKLSSNGLVRFTTLLVKLDLIIPLDELSVKIDDVISICTRPFTCTSRVTSGLTQIEHKAKFQLGFSVVPRRV